MCVVLRSWILVSWKWQTRSVLFSGRFNITRVVLIEFACCKRKVIAPDISMHYSREIYWGVKKKWRTWNSMHVIISNRLGTYSCSIRNKKVSWLINPHTSSKVICSLLRLSSLHSTGFVPFADWHQRFRDAFILYSYTRFWLPGTLKEKGGEALSLILFRNYCLSWNGYERRWRNNKHERPWSYSRPSDKPK